MNKILISTVLAFCLLSSIGFSGQYDLIYTNRNISINQTNETLQTTNYNFWVNSTYIILTGYNGSALPASWYHLAFFNWGGAFTGRYVNFSDVVGVNGLDWNGTHYGITSTGSDRFRIFNTTWDIVANYISYGNLETAGQISPYWLAGDQISDKIYYHNYTGGNIANITFGSFCTIPHGLTSYEDKIYVLCSNGTDDLIMRYNNNTNYDNYILNLTGTCVFPKGISVNDNYLYYLCNGTHVLEYQIIGKDITSTPGNITRDVIDIQRQLLGIRNQADALMLYSIGIAAFFGLLAVIMIRKQPIILFTITFMLGLITFSYIGWLPTVFLFMMIVISGIILAWKLSSVFIGDS